MLSTAQQERRTKIVCSLGPKAASVDMIAEMLAAGMNVARQNFSHDDHETHYDRFQNFKEACRVAAAPATILLDTKGPEIRTAMLHPDFEDGLPIRTGDDVMVHAVGEQYTTWQGYRAADGVAHVGLSYGKLASSVKPGNKILLADGKLALQVADVAGPDRVLCKALNAGSLGERKNGALPGVLVDLPVLGPKDVHDLQQYACKHGSDYVAVSFVQTGRDVEHVRRVLAEAGGSHVGVISKVESIQGVRNYPAILAASDAIMIARGDLGMEMPPWKIQAAQAYMTALARRVGKPVICATQMLDSLQKGAYPTPAELSDVANAVLQRVDACMLSGETGGGRDPPRAIRTMAAIIREAEARQERGPSRQWIGVRRDAHVSPGAAGGDVQGSGGVSSGLLGVMAAAARAVGACGVGREQAAVTTAANGGVEMLPQAGGLALVVDTDSAAVVKLLAELAGKERLALPVVVRTDNDEALRTCNLTHGLLPARRNPAAPNVSKSSDPSQLPPPARRHLPPVATPALTLTHVTTPDRHTWQVAISGEAARKLGAYAQQHVRQALAARPAACEPATLASRLMPTGKGGQYEQYDEAEGVRLCGAVITDSTSEGTMEALLPAGFLVLVSTGELEADKKLFSKVARLVQAYSDSGAAPPRILLDVAACRRDGQAMNRPDASPYPPEAAYQLCSDVKLHVDADLVPVELPHLPKPLSSGVDVMQGERFLPEDLPEAPAASTASTASLWLPDIQESVLAIFGDRPPRAPPVAANASREGRPAKRLGWVRVTGSEDISAIPWDELDGVVLWRECSQELRAAPHAAQLPFVQKSVLAAAQLRRIPVLVGGKVLDSMGGTPWPTRAEMTDVADAVLDGAAGVVLAGEPVEGRYVTDALRTAHNIAREAELQLEPPLRSLGAHLPPSLADIGAYVLRTLLTHVLQGNAASAELHYSDPAHVMGYRQLRTSSSPSWGVLEDTLAQPVGDVPAWKGGDRVKAQERDGEASDGKLTIQPPAGSALVAELEWAGAGEGVAKIVFTTSPTAERAQRQSVLSLLSAERGNWEGPTWGPV